jgi:hypothetical protein
MFRDVFVQHEIDFKGSGQPPASSNPQFALLSPAFAADFGITIGSTPETRFFVGVEAWLDLPGDKSAPTGLGTVSSGGTSNAQLTVTQTTIPSLFSPQLYVGPTIGLVFGR